MLDSISHFFLRFGHITFILPITGLGMLFHRRDLYAKAAGFLFLVMIWNTLLKHIFKVPLLAHLGDGYAFPSGHMHIAAVFYGYILYKIENKILKIMLGSLIGFLGLSLIHCNFHNFFDVLGAIGFAIMELMSYHFLLRYVGAKGVAIIALVFSSVLMIVLTVIYKVEAYHIWLAFYGLIGIIFSLSTIDERKPKLISQKILAVLIMAILVFFVYFIFKAVNFKQPYLSEIKFGLLPIVIMGVINSVANFTRSDRNRNRNNF